MAAVIFGLVGVVIGGLLTGAVQLYVEHVRNHRALRMAARFLIEHWVGLMVWIRRARSTEEDYEELMRIPFDLTIWERYRELLTAHLSYDDWATLSSAAAHEKSEGAFPVKDLSKLDSETEKGFEEFADELDEATKLLRPLAR